MATYLILNCLFIIALCLLLRIRPHRLSKPWLIMFVSLIVMTAIFDSIIVGLSIVEYNQEKILGLSVGLAPIEDFFYAILAAIIVPVIWNRLNVKKQKQHD